MTASPKGQPSVNVTREVKEFLLAAAQHAGTDESTILATVLGAQPITDRPDCARHLERLKPEAASVLVELDRLLRIANPGSQWVFREQYIGYRRIEGQQPSGPKSSRSQIYASLVPRRPFVRLVLPVDPGQFGHVSGLTDVRNKGHHGVGDTAVDIHTVDEAAQALRDFAVWLAPTRGGT